VKIPFADPLPVDTNNVRSMNHTNEVAEMCNATDSNWEENTIADLLRRAKRTPWFKDVIRDAKYFQNEQGYSWVCALKISCNYWLS
jgi:hypothetical protein